MYYAYFESTGKVLSVTSQQSTFPDPAIIECEVSDGTDANSIYLNLESLQVAQKQPFNVMTAYNKISGLPAGTRVITSEGEHVVDDGSIEFDANVAASLTAFLEHPHYFPIHVTVATGPEAS